MGHLQRSNGEVLFARRIATLARLLATSICVQYKINIGHLEEVSADKSSIGFEFQDYVFLEKLLRLEPEEVLGLETYDDIHIARHSKQGALEELVLIQVKHTLTEANVTDRDADLWKTLHNWLTSLDELPPCPRTTFQFYTNKKLNEQAFVTLLKNPASNLSAIRQHIRNTHKDVAQADALKKKGASANPIAKFAKKLAKASDKDLDFIFERFEFHSDSGLIIERITDRLRYFEVPDSRLTDTRQHLFGAFKESKYFATLAGAKTALSYDDFRRTMGFRRILRSARADPVNFAEFVDLHYTYPRPDKRSFADSHFQRQLSDLGIGDDEIIERGVDMLATEKFLESLEKEGDFGREDNERLLRSGEGVWQRLHQKLHRKTAIEDESAHQTSAQACYDQTLEQELRSGDMVLPTGMSAGTFIKLSDVPRIGWRKDWETKFKK